ncbi:MAG: helix-turn-helix domain-containing protein [Candidatus Woesearchaeota archaeon]
MNSGNSGILCKDEGNKRKSMPTLILQSPQALGILTNPVRLHMLKLLQQTPAYPAELAKTMHLHEQKVYYHLKQLLASGLIAEHERKEVRGTIAKRYVAKAASFCVVLEEQWKEQATSFSEQAATISDDIAWFFEPFIEEHKLAATLVVGSPDAHGKYKAYARDGHYAAELSLFLGSLAKMPSHFSIITDVDAKKEHKLSQNLILLGGPVTNSIVEEINEKLPVSFVEQPWGLKSKKTGKTYHEENIGTIQCIKNPYSEKHWILLLAGIRAIGTKNAIIALTRERSVIAKAFMAKKRPFSLVVQGFDLQANGELESIEILE